MSQTHALEASFQQSLRRAEELGKRGAGFSAWEIQEVRLLWEQNAEILPQIYPRFCLLANLAKALRTLVRYSALANANEEMKRYLAGQLRHCQRAIDEHNEFEVDNPIELPEFSADEPEELCGAQQLELLALAEFKSYPNLHTIMMASLKSSLFGSPRIALRAFESWEAFIYVAPSTSPVAILFTLMGTGEEGLSVEERNQLFIAADERVQLELPGWARKRNLETLASWRESVARLAGGPLGFRQIGVISPILRVGIWLRALHLADWNEPVMIQPLNLQAGAKPAG